MGRIGIIAEPSPVKLKLFILYAAAALPACSGKSPKGSESYPLRGEVVAIDSASSRITVAHGDIPGLMKSMTMAFRARNPGLLKTASVGDSVSGILVRFGEEIYLDTLIAFWKPAKEIH